jgi:hypothetical protein
MDWEVDLDCTFDGAFAGDRSELLVVASALNADVLGRELGGVTGLAKLDANFAGGKPLLVMLIDDRKKEVITEVSGHFVSYGGRAVVALGARPDGLHE